MFVSNHKQLKKNCIQIRRVARIWKRGGGLFWKSEKCAYDVDSNFHWPWISFRRFVRNLRRNVSETSEIQRFFSPKIRWSPKKKKKKKKKKGLRQNSEWFFGRNPKFKRFFRPKLGDLQKKKKVFAKIQSDFSAEIRNSNVFSAKKKKKKKKKGLRQNSEWFFSQVSQVQTSEGGLFSNGGGAIFHFSQKIGLKSTKYMRFSILHKPMGGGSSPPRPPPGYATDSNPNA